MIQHKIAGDTFAGLGRELLDELQPRAEAAVNKALGIGHASVMSLLSRPAGPGELRGSKAGAPPFLRRGTLRRSVKIREARTTGNVIAGAIYSNHVAAGAHEFGGTVGRRKKVRLAARPYIRPGLEQAEPEIQAALEAL